MDGIEGLVEGILIQFVGQRGPGISTTSSTQRQEYRRSRRTIAVLLAVFLLDTGGGRHGGLVPLVNLEADRPQSDGCYDDIRRASCSLSHFYRLEGCGTVEQMPGKVEQRIKIAVVAWSGRRCQRDSSA